MKAIKKSIKSETGYPVIFHIKNPGFKEKVNELSFILDNWVIFENNVDDPVLKTGLKNARAGSPFGGPSPNLTLGQLFSAWRSDKLIHSAYYDNDNVEIPENLYQVGMGCGLSGAYVFWGIVPSRKTIVYGNRSPICGVCDIGYNMRTYKQAAEDKILGKSSCYFSKG